MQTSQIRTAIHPATEVAAVTLKVSDLGRALTFYTELIGLQVFTQNENGAVLGAGKRPILTLEAVRNAIRQPAGTTGLYHAAILLPNRHALAVKIAQIAAMRYPLGQGDHLVSEAFYLSDPDGNGLEIYRDRPRSEWHWANGQVRMATDPVDMDSLFAEIVPNDAALDNPALPDGTKLGHMHLRVGNIADAEKFYHGVLGFDIVASMPQALFVSAGGYHHHIGMNTWESRNGKPMPEGSVGLGAFSIVLPDQAERERLIGQIEAAGIRVEQTDDTVSVRDPWQNQIMLTHSI